MQCDRRKSVIIFVSGKFSELGAGINKGTSLGYASLLASLARLASLFRGENLIKYLL